jgi:hypothetical protein
MNDDHHGYHDTITRVFIAGVRWFLDHQSDKELVALVNALLASEIGKRDWPLRFYSRELLMSVSARRGLVAPDLAPLP